MACAVQHVKIHGGAVCFPPTSGTVDCFIGLLPPNGPTPLWSEHKGFLGASLHRQADFIKD